MRLLTRKQIKDRKKTESPIESALLREFHLLGYYPVPQYWLGNYRIDLAFVDEKLAIECDGKEWHSSPEQILRDKEKDDFLRNIGWCVLRISGSEIYRSADEIVKYILSMPTRSQGPMNRKSNLIEIDYELDDFEEIEEKEKMVKQLAEEVENYDVGKFKSISNVMAERYKFSI